MISEQGSREVQEQPTLEVTGRIVSVARKGQESWKVNLVVDADPNMDFRTLSLLMDNPAEIRIVGLQAAMNLDGPAASFGPVLCADCGQATGSLADDGNPDNLCGDCARRRAA